MRLAAHADKGEAVREVVHPGLHRLADAAGLPPRVDAAGGEHHKALVPRRHREGEGKAAPAREHHRHVRQDGQIHGSGLSRLVGDPPGNGGLYGNRHRRRIKGLDDAGQRRPHFRLPAVEGRAQGFDGLGPSFSSVHHRASSKGS